ncbi:MAG: DUF3794 domain-containing protein [Oscillospiraceae bacterium]|nr:DUF3794 domain-containing protein [Oscillospiraceae bacterium]
MDFSMKKETMITQELYSEVSGEQNMELEMNLPDYCSDIKRILKCCVEPGITAVTAAGENLSAVGSITVRLIYVGDKDNIDCYEVSRDLNVTAKAKNMPADAVIRAYASVNYANCRATSQRKAGVGANITVNFTLLRLRETQLPSQAQGCGVQVLSQKVQYGHCRAMKERAFDMGETAQLPKDKPAVGKLLHCSAYAVVDSKKAVTDKLLIKGDLHVDILYCTEAENKTEKFHHVMPISQIIDLPGIDDKSECNAEIRLRRLIVTPKSDSSGNCHLLEIGAKVCAFIQCCEIKSIDTIADCYSVSHEIEAENTIQEFLVPVQSVDRLKTVRRTLEIPSADIASVCDIWCSDITASMKGQGDSAKALCSATVCILYLDSKNIPEYVEKTVDFDFSVKLKEKYEYLKCSVLAQPRNVDCSLQGKTKIEVILETGISGEILSSSTKRLCKNITVSEKPAKKEDTPALTLYFCQKGERLWDIARKYNTTAEAIQSENGIDGGEIAKDSMIMIPCV